MAPPAIDINCMTLFELSLHPTSGISFAFALDVDALPSISVAGKPAQNFAAGAADSCVLQGRHLPWAPAGLLGRLFSRLAPGKASIQFVPP